MRLAQGGLIDRQKPVRFRFDGVSYKGYAGDTVASALMANGVKILGRSFKYHRPRGAVAAGSEEPNALITTGTGAQAEPNVRATVQEIYPGLETRSQNAWPTLGFDLMALNDLASPFLGAGFYYKTFMWPKRFWEAVYEPVIRRAAGLGALSGKSNCDSYEKAFAFCDVLVIGAGPAGLMAALTAGRAGADVILADEDSLMGGRLNAETEAVGDMAGSGWAAQTVTELASLPNVRLMARTTVTGAYDGGLFGAIERVGQHIAPDGRPLACFWRIAAKQTVLAAGAVERAVAFRNNDRPGIIGAGALRAYVNRWGVAPGRRVVVFGNNDDAHRSARDLRAAGVHVVAVIDSRDKVGREDDFPIYKGAVVTNVAGRSRIQSVTIEQGGRTQKLHADCLAVSGGWNPSVHLTCHLGGRPRWRQDIQAFVPTENSVPNMVAIGACNGTFSTGGCLREGLAAGAAAAEAVGFSDPAIEVPKAEEGSYAISPLWAVPGKGRAWLDLQNDVTVKDVKQAAQENFVSVEHMKRYTTQGMATDQGKASNISALAILADATGRGVAETGTTTYRPPYTPVPIAAMGAGGQGHGFAPERQMTSHAASVERGAPMIEAGLWYRPSYFPKPGETSWRASCDREVGYVRNAVGVSDVSTLGKIDIQGPDSAQLLDLVYTNTFSSLKVGRVRYGLMLREDGHVMDDGTTARLGPHHYLMTTTTAAAGLVMRHLEFICQGLHPEWQVAFSSVTEQWAQFAVAGPQARDLLNAVLDTPLDGKHWPFMACGAVSIGGVEGRLFRISFSGEHAYEIAVPARYGAALFDVLVSAAVARGGGAYGMEALNVLRIEKGFLTHAEIEGRATAFDVGMAGMISPKKDCIGKVMAARPGLIDPNRPQMVGLLAPSGGTLTGGAHLFTQGTPAVREQYQGHIASVAFSPTVGTMIGLGFLKNGPARLGETVRVVDHMRGIDSLAEVCRPVFVDPNGGRARA
ncbi:MAG: sarcosine oxidase subunit alpha family protein [Pseudomonadota bacterium]